MNLFGGVIPVTGISFLLFCLFAILFVGYALGRITIKGVSEGTTSAIVGTTQYDITVKAHTVTGINFYSRIADEIQTNPLHDQADCANKGGYPSKREKPAEQICPDITIHW